MLQKWPVRIGRPFSVKTAPDTPLVTGQRILDTLFPLTKGGTGAIPGAFGTGKTVTQQQLAKWSDAEIVVYIGCGERGNEMTEVLTTFPFLDDPKTGKPLMGRTILIANTSNMPVAAREASVYTGMTLAEYYRDMGYNVSLMADSTSRWAEAMREISSRLEEMPGEEGYPAYLSARLSEFYERAGRINTVAGGTGSISVVGAVSPPGGDLNEPVTQNTLRIVRVFWALDSKLRERRHFPAINWLTSYSLYAGQLDGWYKANVAEDFPELRNWATELLQREAELQEIVQLVGSDALPEEQKLILEVTRMIREVFLQQNAYHPVDTYSPLKRQYAYMKVIKMFSDHAEKAVENEVSVEAISNMPIRQRLQRAKLEPTVDQDLEAIMAGMDKDFEALGAK
jgi:V/A-type H+-transporting ATPase subunit A